MSDDRRTLSFSERDRLRREGRDGDGAPRGRRAQQQQARATGAALKDADALFALGKGGSRAAALAKEIRERHGTAELIPACQAYLDEIGVPVDPSLLALFLDTAEPALVVPALEALLEQKHAGSLEISSALRSQLRVLEQDRDDSVAGISEELLGG